MKKDLIIPQTCPHCEGKGYTEIRDCSGEIQREETCFFCEGTGEFIPEKDKIRITNLDSEQTV